MISTIVLNWNRAALLERTLRSFAETLAEPYELFVVDNASTDGSRDVIESFRATIPRLVTVYHDRNLGGDGLNVAIEQARGELIQLHENDLVLLPGWRAYAAAAFGAFPDLGQLSLFSGVPPDDYAGDSQPALLRLAAGTIAYEALGNLGTSSILRAALLRDHGIRVHTVEPRDPAAFPFADDPRLSAEVKAAGRWCAWSERHYVLNLGHDIDEFERDPDYYRANYASKAHLGEAGWSERVAAARAAPRPRRASALFPGAHVQPERTAGACAGTAARLWSMLDAVSPEVEVLDLLYAIVRAVKPARALDAGGWLGRSAIAIASALRDNGFGTLTAVRGEGDAALGAAAGVAHAGLAEIVTFAAREDAAALGPFGVAFFATRDANELLRDYDALADGAVIVCAGPAAAGGAASLEQLAAAGAIDGTVLRVPRGLFVGTLRRRADGALERLPPGFDARAYLDANPDIAAAGADPAHHYRTTGWREGRTLGASGGADTYAAWQASFGQRDAWEEMYRRGAWDHLGEIAEVPRYALVAGYVSALAPPGVVLDAGGGEGILARYLDPARHRYAAFDLAPTAVANARTRLPGASIEIAAIGSFTPPHGARYGAIVFNETIQHTDTPFESLDRYRAYLERDGIIVVSLFEPHEQGRGARLGRLLLAECERGRYALVDRARVESRTHGLSWTVLVLR